MMRVTMLETRRGSHDQYRFFRYDAGKTYNLPDTLAKSYIQRGVAVEEVPRKTKYKRRKKEAI